MFVSYAQNENNTSHRVQAKQMKRPALVPSTPNSKYITRLETGLKGKRYTYIYTEYSPPSPLTYLPLITSELQVLRHIRQMHSQQSSAPVWRAPANAGACAADALCAIFSPFLFRSEASPKNGDTPRWASKKKFSRILGSEPMVLYVSSKSQAGQKQSS